MQTTDTSEKGLETLIESHLIEHNGYRQTTSLDYDKELCINKKLLFEFIKTTQPKAYTTIIERGEAKFIHRLTEQIRNKGTIEVLRKGIIDLNLQVSLYNKKPSSTLNKDTLQGYKENIFSITRQLYYSKANKNSLDMVIFINGLPISTFELKNQFTRQNVKHAIHQYQNDRDPREALFHFGRCIVHFALDADLVYMTTHLNKSNTFFLPFNKGLKAGGGNPLNPNGLKTDYLWKDILTKESLSNIIENYVQLIKEKNQDTGKIISKLIFPRYHQLRAVKSILTHAKENGLGQKYLIQHSAGSGKSNSITWLAHQLVSLHNTENTEAVFDSVIVVTDRRVLDKQIRDNIKQFAQVSSVVEAIDKGSQQLKQALKDGKKIIITTVQKFPFIIDEIGILQAKKFAIIIDEAHSSQSGETASKMNWVLSEKKTSYGEEKESPSSEDVINELIENRKMLKNGSYFAFTATPKNKTLETFGTQTTTGKFNAFDTYTMKQAIEEEFILDVLKNYTTYQSYYKLNKKVEGNPSFETRQANKKLKAYVENHPFSIMEKSKVILDHFHKDIRTEISGEAKAMVVCKNIKSAIQYYQSFKKYLKEINSPYHAIIAFSGKKDLNGNQVNEAQLNGFSSIDIPTKFKESKYRFLIVANKFQTGFDQPLLHTMYVDKKLSNVQAVQTLSRLNRACPNKKDTLVIDFFNASEDIIKAFEPFYKTTVLSEETDPNKLNDLQDALDNAAVYLEEDLTHFTTLYFKKAGRQALDPIIDKCVANYKSTLNEDDQIDFYLKAKSFFRTYAFLSKILSFKNTYWEKLYWFLKFLIPKIKPNNIEEDLAKGILESIDLSSYRLTRTTQENLTLKGEEELAPTPSIMKGKKEKLGFDDLDTLIQEFNTRFGTDWKADDKRYVFIIQQLPAEFAKDEKTLNAVKKSDRQNAKITSDIKVDDLMQGVINEYSDLYKKFTDEKNFKSEVLDFVFDNIWNKENNSKI